MKLGLTSISFRNESCERIIEESLRADLSFIEWGSDVHAPKSDTAALTKIVRAQNDAGIKCSSYGTYFRLGFDHIDELIPCIEASKTLGSDVLRLWCGTKGSREYALNERKHLFDECQKAAQIAESNHVTFCMECHNNTFTDEIDSALELMKVVNSSSFRMYWQPNQFKSEEDNKEYARLIAPYTQNIHVFNWKGDRRYPLQSAVSLWKEYLSYFDGSQVLLLEFMPDNRISSLMHEARALNAIAGGDLI